MYTNVAYFVFALLLIIIDILFAILCLSMDGGICIANHMLLGNGSVPQIDFECYTSDGF